MQQLGADGRLVIPLGKTVYSQRLLVYSRREDQLIEEEDLAVRFVPLVEGGGGYLSRKARVP